MEGKTMNKIKHITVAVSPELYRQTRHLAAEYDSTVTAIVAYLLERLPQALKAARFPVGGASAASKPTGPAQEAVISPQKPPTPH
jgi:hypothetical protein